jgi:hypothetical protein
VLDERRQNFERIRANDEFVMIRAEVFGNAARVMQFAEILFLKADGKSFNGRARFLTHQGNDGGGINAAGEKRAERDFRDKAYADGFTQ